MKLVFLCVAIVCAVALVAAQTGSAQAPTTVKVLGCLQGDGSDAKPWVLAGAALPPPPAAVPAGGGPGGGGGGGRGGGRGGGGGGAGAPGAGAPPVAGAPPANGAPPAAGGQGAGPGGGGGRGGGGRGGGGRGGGGGGAPPAPAPPVQLVDLRLTGGMDMKPWQNMRVEVEGTLGAKSASGLQELSVTYARSVQGVCTPK
jgi:hypothetical protein